MENLVNTTYREVTEFFSQADPYKSVLILITSIVVSYWLSRFVAQFFVAIAKRVAIRSDETSDEKQVLKLRQIETYLGVAVAAVRAITVAIVAYIAWRVLSPEGSAQLGGSGAAAIGASAFFIVFAGQTLGTLLRDITAGTTMIVEQWFNVGDFIKVEPFWNVAGVVERLTLRSTRLRSLSGEIIIIHNQKIDAVHVTPNGVRKMAVEIFVNDRVRGERFVEKVIHTMPTGRAMLASPLRIAQIEKWGEEAWRINVTGQTAPGREWLIDTYFINALRESDDKRPAAKRLMAHPPIARWADETAERRFTRAIRTGEK